jgi:hypothetical protein
MAGLGTLSGAAFCGVAIFPSNLHHSLHAQCVLWAFRCFTLAVICALAALRYRPDYPRLASGIFAVFSLLLVGYVLLITRGPSTHTLEGLMIQATGQKIIVYASILAVFAQAVVAWRHARLS